MGAVPPYRRQLGDPDAAFAEADGVVEGEVKTLMRNTGPSLSPFNAWVLTKGLETLRMRVLHSNAGAEQIASWLEGHPRVRRVLMRCAALMHTGTTTSTPKPSLVTQASQPPWGRTRRSCSMASAPCRSADPSGASSLRSP